MRYIVFDLEATCWNPKPDDLQMEIIEIGAVMLDENQKVIGEYQSFIKPRVNPILSEFCTSLTGITQTDIDVARPFNEVFPEFIAWATPTIESRDYTWFCSWGFYDKKQIEADLLLHRMNRRYEWVTQKHISVKHQHGAIYDNPKGVGMPKALEREGLTLEGDHHRALDDAKNITKIFQKIFPQLKFEVSK